MNLTVVALHRNWHYLKQTCQLLNDEWKRSETARLHSLNSSCDTLPTCLIMVQDDAVIGHAKLTKIPSIKAACFVESVVIAKDLRRRGLGTILMQKTEDYCRNCLHLECVYLSTHDREEFYSKLGYTRCAPVSLYGGSIQDSFNSSKRPSMENLKVKNGEISEKKFGCEKEKEISLKDRLPVLDESSSKVQNFVKVPFVNSPVVPPPPLPSFQTSIQKIPKVYMMKIL